jgi:hypothetical protein
MVKKIGISIASLVALTTLWLVGTGAAPPAALFQLAPPSNVNVGAPLTPGSVVNPLVAGRLPAGNTALPNSAWALAGMEGGIPTRTTVCTTLGTAGQSRTFAQSVTLAQINSAIAACGDSQVVMLETGTYGPYSSGVDFAGNDNRTLRGEGADNTLLYFTGVTSCLGTAGQSMICMRDSGLTYYGPGPPQNQVTWTAGYAQGSTSLTLSSTPNLAVGMWIELDQLLDSSDTGNVFVCNEVWNGSSGCTQQGSTPMGRTSRPQHQRVKVVSCTPACGGGTSTTVVVTPGVYMPNIRSGQSPGAWWGSSTGLATGNGVENLSIDGTNIADGHPFYYGVTFIFSVNSWLRNVRIANCPTPKNCVNIAASNHITVESNYFYGNTYDDIGSTTYGVEIFGGGDNLIWNNITHHRASPMVSDGDQGSVFAYNYSFDDWYNPTPCEMGALPAPYCDFMQASNYSHEAGNGMILHEGNESTGAKGDIIHGTSNLFTYFRNRFIGWEPVKVNELGPVFLYADNRYYAFVCNVLGLSGTHTTYATGTGANGDIWRFGGGYSGQGANPAIPSDPIVASSALRWGNWDVVTSSADNTSGDQTGTRWVSGEVPSGDSYLPNPVPSTQTCPASYFRSTKPAFWGNTIPWPAIGPDVSGGNITNTGGHVHKNPAHTCFDSLTDDTEYAIDEYGIRPKHYDASLCYPAP